MSVPELKLDTAPAAPARRGPVTNKWRAKKWEPMFDEWVVRSCLGESNLSIAQRSKYTPQHVCAVLNQPQAKLLRRQLMESLRKNIELKTEERLSHLSDKALQRLTQVMDDDRLVESHPFAIADRSMAILKGLGHFKSSDGATINAKNAVFVSPEISALIGEGLRKAQEARLLNPPSASIELDVTPR